MPFADRPGGQHKPPQKLILWRVRSIDDLPTDAPENKHLYVTEAQRWFQLVAR